VDVRRRNVLVVDDEPEVVEAIQDLLRREYRVLGATRAREGIDILAHEQVDVVMTDQSMPDMSGWSCSITSAERTPTRRACWSPAMPTCSRHRRHQRGRVYRYITKPWEAGELQAVVRDAVERHDLVVERQQRAGRSSNGRTRSSRSRTPRSPRRTRLNRASFTWAATSYARRLAILLPLVDLAARHDEVGEPLRGWLQGMARATVDASTSSSTK
jgi:DNA-binding NtrC family response regulator